MRTLAQVLTDRTHAIRSDGGEDLKQTQLLQFPTLYHIERNI